MPSLSWVEVHGAVTHMPLACLLLSPLFEIGALIFGKPEWRVVSFWLLVAAVVFAVPALGSGWITGNDMRYTATPEQPVLFTRHRLAAFIAAGIAISQLAWRIYHRDEPRRPVVVLGIALSLGAAAVIGFAGYLGGKMVFGGADENALAEPARSPRAAAESKKSGAPATAGLVATGAALFKQYHCQSCHRLDGQGAGAGPDLTHEGQRHNDAAWQLAHLKNPQQMVPGSAMPAQADLPAPDLKALAAFLAARK